jgi:hypothetical protein
LQRGHTQRHDLDNRWWCNDNWWIDDRRVDYDDDHHDLIGNGHRIRDDQRYHDRYDWNDHRSSLRPELHAELGCLPGMLLYLPGR